MLIAKAMNVIGIPLLTPVCTTVGIFAGGTVWLGLYATRVGVIEFDGPAALGIAIGVIVGGAVGGTVGLLYDLRDKQKFTEIWAAFMSTLGIVGFIFGSGLTYYSQHKWDYAGTHQTECSLPEPDRPFACG